MRIRNEINPQYTLMKNTIKQDFDRTTVKMDYQKGGGFLRPEVSPVLTKYVVLNNGNLNKCTKVLAQDTVLQNFIFDTEKEDQRKILDNFWDKTNKYQFYLAVQERYQYGWGALEVITNEMNVPVSLIQFPSQTAVIKKKGELYYAVQRGIQGGDKTLRLFDRLDTYPEEDNHLPICLWLGGGATHEFYDVPAWFPEANKVLAKINLDMLNGDQINNGNNIDGILNIFGPPQRPNVDGETPEDRLKKQIKETGTGTMVTYMESVSPDFPLKMGYVKISNDNWDYLQSFSESCDKALMSNYSIPKARLMIDDVTESMNSNKTETIWEIYTVSLNYEQYPNELIIREFNKIAFGIDADLEMEVPIFSDKKQIELQNIIQLFNSGLITVGQAIHAIEPLLPQIDFSKIDYDAPYMNERLYNGNVMGMVEEDNFNGMFDFLQGVKLE